MPIPIRPPIPPVKKVTSGSLLQHISRESYRDSSLHFGRSGKDRYDDPQKKFGALYLAFDLPTALMESVFHEHRWSTRKPRTIKQSEIVQRLVRAIGVVSDLHLADLNAPGVMASLGLNLSQLVGRRYKQTQTLSRWIYELLGPDGIPLFDGISYPSRNNHPGTCIALFDRAQAKVEVILDLDLANHKDWPRFVKDFQIHIRLA